MLCISCCSLVLCQGVSCICSAFSGMAAGRMATSGGHVSLLLATALSLAVIACTVAGASRNTLGGGRWKAGGNGGESGLVRPKDEGGLLRVLRWGKRANILRGRRFDSPSIVAKL